MVGVLGYALSHCSSAHLETRRVCIGFTVGSIDESVASDAWLVSFFEVAVCGLVGVTSGNLRVVFVDELLLVSN